MPRRQSQPSAAATGFEMTEFGMNLNAMILFDLSIMREAIKSRGIQNECPCKEGLDNPDIQVSEDLGAGRYTCHLCRVALRTVALTHQPRITPATQTRMTGRNLA